jgi:hypothetical protein
MDIEQLSRSFDNFVSGFWHKYYVHNLPTLIRDNPNSVSDEVEGLFAGFREQVARAAEVYDSLTAQDRLLLDDAFNLTFLAHLGSSHVYMHDAIPSLLAGKGRDELRRDPIEIGAHPQGVKPEQIIAVYIPDEVRELPVGDVALQKLEALGINPNQVKSSSQLSGYDHCLVRYGQGFNGHALVQLIQEGKFKHILY